MKWRERLFVFIVRSRSAVSRQVTLTFLSAMQLNRNHLYDMHVYVRTWSHNTHIRARMKKGVIIRGKEEGEVDTIRSRVLVRPFAYDSYSLRIFRSRSSLWPPFDDRTRVSSHAETGINASLLIIGRAQPTEKMSSENDSEMDCSDSDCGDPGYEDYYNIQPWGGDVDNDVDPEQNRRDPEYAVYDCLRVEQVERLLNESVEVLSTSLHVTPSLAKVLLHAHNWASQDIATKYRTNASSLLINSKIKPTPEQVPGTKNQRGGSCLVCVMVCPADRFATLTCGHSFCKDCWCMHFEVQITQGISTGISCMAQDCDVLAPEDFVLSLLTKPNMRERYQQFAFCDYVKSHPQLRFCPGPNCQIVLRSKEQRAKRVKCSSCKTVFCFRCGMDYHAPTDCSTIKKWLTKCADDSETANYISAHTKDCPKCHICIEKNGGCNHMQCYNCKHDFCWMCLGDWKAHGSEYYECSRYKENPNIAHESVHAQAREALKKYLHYYERWENHSKSLKLEEQTLEGIKMRINNKVMNASGTWIDWQHLFEAASLLARCRYTLQYTYPYAYYMESGPRKELFEYQQAQLEAEIENLSWKIERAETTDRGDLENQMDIAEKRRVTLLKDFLE